MMLYNKPKPLFHLGSFPVSVVGLIILIQLIGMVVFAITGGGILDWTSFFPQAFREGDVWRLFTYPLVSPLGIMALIGLFFFYQFGTTVEAALERKPFIMLVCSILLVTPIILTLFHLFNLPESAPLYGTQVLTLAVFCCFCVMHPNLPVFFFQIPVKWLGLVFFIITLLGSITYRDWGMGLSYVVATGLSIWMIQSKGLAGLKLFPDSVTFSKRVKKGSPRKKQKPRSIKKKITPHLKKKPAARPAASKIKPQVSIPDDTEIDTILDKINEKGLHSLTQEEREKLESVSKK